MRDLTKVIIGFGSIWGLLACGAVAASFLFVGKGDTASEMVTMALYGFTILPACLFAIRYPRISGWWLLIVAGITTIGLGYQEFCHSGHREMHGEFLEHILQSLIIAGIPALIGYSLLRSLPSTHGSTPR